MHTSLTFSESPRLSLRRLFLREPVSSLRMIVLAAVVLESPDLIWVLLFGDGGIPWLPLCFAVVFYVLAGLLVWCASRWVDPLLERRYPHSPLLRHVSSALMIVTGTMVVCCLLYQFALPFITGKPPADALDQCVWCYHVTVVALLIYAWLVLGRASRLQAGTIFNAQLETDLIATGLANAELAMLEAQIEPHFLFNTLAHVQRQYRHDVNAANQMLSDLIEYLDRALPALQRSDWTVGDELALIRLYLNILAQRFGKRLGFQIIAADCCESLPLPALTIATLVENSVRHGIAPVPEGGTVSINVDADDAQLRIEVSDDGVGLRQSQGTGLGLATVRARLKSVFGYRATLALQARQSGGVLATIRIDAAI
jgi:hypothetical protein